MDLVAGCDGCCHAREELLGLKLINKSQEVVLIATQSSYCRYRPGRGRGYHDVVGTP